MEQPEDGRLAAEQQGRPYYSLTSIARRHSEDSPGYVIQSWLRNRNTLEFLRIWEKDNNPDFRASEYAELLQRIKDGSFTLTPKQWIEKTGAIGMVSKQGKNGGTYAQQDIACAFLSWISPKFKYLMIKTFELSNQIHRHDFDGDLE